jgi:hypothetical protein
MHTILSMLLAQDAGVPAVPADFADITSGVALLLNSAHTGHFLLAVIVALFLLSKLAIWGGKKLPGAVGAWFATPLATWLVPQAVSVLGGALSVLAVPGASMSVDTILSAIIVGLTVGGHGAVNAAKAQEAEKIARAEVTSKPEAIAEVQKAVDAANENKGPQP